ncbi:conserved hypothetical protein [Vibrio jasicida]|nr:conserved hypothetical protein [Vibrio jasicida]
MVDAPDLGSGAARCESSSLSDRTILSLIGKHLAERLRPVGLSPSGKAAAFDAAIPWFESR